MWYLLVTINYKIPSRWHQTSVMVIYVNDKLTLHKFTKDGITIQNKFAKVLYALKHGMQQTFNKYNFC